MTDHTTPAPKTPQRAAQGPAMAADAQSALSAGVYEWMNSHPGIITGGIKEWLDDKETP